MHFRDLDPILGPATAGRRPGGPTALAALTAGLSNDLPPRLVRLWLQSRRPESGPDAISDRAWTRHVTAARKRVVVSSSARGRGDLATAASRRLVGSLLSPVPFPNRAGFSPARVAGARHAAAIVGLEILASIEERGWDTAIVPTAWLAVRQGTSQPTGMRTLQAAVTMGFLTLVSRKPGGAGRYRMRTLPKERGKRAWDAADTVEELGGLFGFEGVDEAPLVAIIRSAAHPVWGYDPEATVRTWLACIAHTQGTDLTHYGFSRKVALEQIAIAARLGLLEGDLKATLDGRAATHGAAASFAVAEQKRLDAAAERKDQLRAVREARAAARSAIEEGLDVAGRHLPEPHWAREKSAHWASAMHTALASLELDATTSADVRRDLQKRLERRGWDADRAATIAGRIAPAQEGDGNSGEDHLDHLLAQLGGELPSPDGDRTAATAWAQRAHDAVHSVELDADQLARLSEDLAALLTGTGWDAETAHRVAEKIVTPRAA